MNKNKTIAYAIAATLLVGGTFIGTKALFTDVVDTVGELSISTGDVDLNLEVVSDWTLDRNGEEPNTGTPDPETDQLAEFDNLKYGDVLTKKVEITNIGTLKAVVNFEEDTKVTENLPEGIEYKAVFKDNKGEEIKNGSVMPIGSSGIVEFKIEVVEGGKHNESGSLNSDKQEETRINLNESYLLEAKQITKETVLN